MLMLKSPGVVLALDSCDVVMDVESSFSAAVVDSCVLSFAKPVGIVSEVIELMSEPVD
jgi:hypothetical protein